MTSAPKSDRITAALGPAMKLAKFTTFTPARILSVVFSVATGRCISRVGYVISFGISGATTPVRGPAVAERARDKLVQHSSGEVGRPVQRASMLRRRRSLDDGSTGRTHGCPAARDQNRLRLASGHTEYVVNSLIQDLEQLAPDRQIVATMAERTQPDDLSIGNVLVLASATWNTGGSEGQLNPHMRALLQEKATDVDLGGKPCACIGLGDDRYFYTARAVDLLQDYVTGHRGRLLIPSLRIVNEPYGREEKVRVWARQLVKASLQISWS